MKGYGLSGIRAKLVLAYVAALVAALLLMGVYLTYRLERMVAHGNRANSEAALAQLKNNYAQFLANYDGKLDSLLSDSTFTRFLTTDFEEDSEAILALREQIIPYLRLMGLDRGRTIFRAYTDNPTIRFGEIVNYSLNDLRAEPWYRPGSGRASTWISTQTIQGRNQGLYVGCYRVLPDSAVAVFFEEAALYAQIETWQEHNRRAYLIDQSGKILSSSDRALVFRSAHDFLLDDGRPIIQARGDETVFLNGDSYYLSRIALPRPSESGNWAILSLTSTHDQSAQIAAIWQSSLILSLCCLLISALLATRFASGLTNRIQKFLRNMQRVWDSNFSLDVEVTGTDEISSIERGFNRLAHNTHRLIHDVYLANLTASRLREEKTDAELIALRRQINPHYLFNTLETIRMNMILEGDRENARMLGLFAESFRDCISGGEGTHTLREELGFVEKYFVIQRYCYRGEIALTIQSDEALADAIIPQLILQPLVENAIYHGIELKGAPGTVRVVARRQDDVLVLTVQDDGVGMSEETIANIRRQLKDAQPPNEGNRVALRNVNSRLSLLYGAQFQLTIESGVGSGTRVTIRLPLADGGTADV